MNDEFKLQWKDNSIVFGFSDGYLDIEIVNGFNKASFDLPFSDALELYDKLEEYVKIWKGK